MSSATIYKIKKKGYLLFASVKTVSGFRVGVEPYIIIPEIADADTISEGIKAVLDYDDNKRVPDPKSWPEYNKLFLERTGLKSIRELNKPTNKNIGIRKEQNTIFFTPSKPAENPDEGFLYKSNDDIIKVPFTALNEAILEAFELALSKCE